VGIAAAAAAAACVGLCTPAAVHAISTSGSGLRFDLHPILPPNASPAAGSDASEHGWRPRRHPLGTGQQQADGAARGAICRARGAVHGPALHGGPEGLALPWRRSGTACGRPRWWLHGGCGGGRRPGVGGREVSGVGLRSEAINPAGLVSEAKCSVIGPALVSCRPILFLSLSLFCVL
jgi:hypothetical protein